MLEDAKLGVVATALAPELTAAISSAKPALVAAAGTEEDLAFTYLTNLAEGFIAKL